MLVVKPKGPGNWRPVTLTIEGPRFDAVTIRPGHTFELGGIVWRVCKVLP